MAPVADSTPNRSADFAGCMVNEALSASQSGTCLRAIKPPFTKRISTVGVDDSNPSQAVSDLLRFLAANVAGAVNDFGGSEFRSGSRQVGTADAAASSVNASAPLG